MFDNKKYKLKTPRKTTRPKKPKKEKSAEKKTGGKLFGGMSLRKESFGKATLAKAQGGKSGKWPAWLKWWHILIASLLLVAIVAGIVLGVVLGGNSNPGGGGGGGQIDPPAEPEGTITAVGTFLPKGTQEYLLCEYDEYFFGGSITVLQRANHLRYDGKPYYVLVYDGEPLYDYSGEYTGEYTQEQTKASLLSLMKSIVGYTDEQLSHCEVHIYEPVGFTRVEIAEATLTDTTVTLKYRAGAVDGELVEHTLTGTYEKSGNDYAFTYENLPEDELLLRVAENLLTSAKYRYYNDYDVWVNALTFGDGYTLTLTIPDAPAE